MINNFIYSAPTKIYFGESLENLGSELKQYGNRVLMTYGGGSIKKIGLYDAFYDITHGLGLAILTPRWMEYILDETTAPKFYQFGVNVFGIDKDLPALEVGKKAIEMLSDFFFNTLGLKSNLTEIGIDDSKFEIMAKKSCGNGMMPGYKQLNQQDVENIFKMCR
ncbi:Fe-dependent oxidoreductase, alcohol dehydrogenase [Desulfosporosinus orientis DSM 765]|uniref:Fe-dependent oxidoreductase, alcohol dehydrogenase n=1 Tax=Desulfosporosinus orientis (strain ATCC 19365 / DSM 765 / NCIMB 8382 / VKM B-1628 / Singapore I) TaxID=768706 RepID=G7W8M8_DESOD|nr:iron-containing alcohol dehydrogenase [Desulfosporosinus orientis]AET67455.1 Fe-dependent oxidoreductase, alcohol dehydrogenase [Desulfosporosinus orientis DSM 765]